MHIESTPIPGLLIVHLDVHGDNRGWFKENWQREKMVAAGLPDFGPVQHNISFNAQPGVTRGLHAEPWDKLVSVAHGRVFGAWCDLREGSETYGQLFTHEVDPATAVFVPRGVANGFQAQEPNTVYSYLVNEHWSADATYTMVNLNMVDWPLEPTEISAKDAQHPPLARATPMPPRPRKVLVTGANGQLGRALQKLYAADATCFGADITGVEFASRGEFDITHDERDWSQYGAIINCAAYNDVNGAESDRAAAWAANALAPARLAAIATRHDLTLVHVSTDYVFGAVADGTGTSRAAAAESAAPEPSAAASVPVRRVADFPAPLSLYGASKAAGEASASAVPRHYVVRTAWVFGEGNNFVATMARLARRGVEPQVVSDQRGRPTHADDLAAGIAHLLRTRAPFGLYHLTNAGEPAGRDELARVTFATAGVDPARVRSVTTAEYAELAGPQADRPLESTLDLTELAATGFTPRDWRAAVQEYVAGLELDA